MARTADLQMIGCRERATSHLQRPQAWCNAGDCCGSTCHTATVHQTIRGLKRTLPNRHRQYVDTCQPTSRIQSNEQRQVPSSSSSSTHSSIQSLRCCHQRATQASPTKIYVKLNLCSQKGTPALPLHSASASVQELRALSRPSTSGTPPFPFVGSPASAVQANAQQQAILQHSSPCIKAIAL